MTFFKNVCIHYLCSVQLLNRKLTCPQILELVDITKDEEPPLPVDSDGGKHLYSELICSSLFVCMYSLF
jgi:hypothetical protein